MTEPKRRAHKRGFDLELAREHLGKRDRQLKRWMNRIGPLDVHWRRRWEPVDALARSIVFQQLSGKAAATIVGRVEQLVPGGRKLAAESLAALTPEQLRSCGVSGNKQRALHDLAEKSLAGVVPSAADMRFLDNEEIIERLTAVRGIGRWTVEMILMFRLGRPDVLPIDDLGVRRGAQILRGYEEMPKPRELAELGERWGPYRTMASLYMWRIVEHATRKTQVAPA